MQGAGKLLDNLLWLLCCSISLKLLQCQPVRLLLS